MFRSISWKKTRSRFCASYFDCFLNWFFSHNSVPFRVSDLTIPWTSKCLGMNTSFCGITETVPNIIPLTTLIIQIQRQSRASWRCCDLIGTQLHSRSRIRIRTSYYLIRIRIQEAQKQHSKKVLNYLYRAGFLEVVLYGSSPTPFPSPDSSSIGDTQED